MKDIRDYRKRAGIISNYCQIMHSLAALNIMHDLKLYERILSKVKLMTRDFSDSIKPRDLQELIWALCHVKSYLDNDKSLIAAKNKECIRFEKELRRLAKVTSVYLGAMTPRSRDIVFESFEKIDFYDAELV